MPTHRRIASRGVYILAALVATVVLTRVAQAVPLPPGATSPIAGVPGELAVVIHDVLIPFEIHGAGGALLYKGTLQNRVRRIVLTGRLEFSYRIRDTQVGLNGAVEVISTTDFTGFTTDVDYASDSLGVVGPDTAARSFDGSMVEFQFNSLPVR